MTDDQRTRLLGALRRGISFRSSCLSAGFTSAQVRAHMQHDAAFSAEVKKAQADAEVVLVVQIQEHAKTDHRAAAWLLSHANPSRYGKGKVEELTEEEVRKIW